MCQRHDNPSRRRPPPFRATRRYLAAAAAIWLLACVTACGSLSQAPAQRRAESPQASEVVLFALGLIDTGYRYGGKNPDAGVDCSGMVSHIFAAAAGLALTGSAADIARAGRAVERAELRGGDLVFFNTLDRPHSHVGIYIGDGRFVHAPSRAGKVRIDRLDARYFAERYDGGRSYFD